MLFTRAKTRTNPVFYDDRLALRLGHDQDRLARIRTEDASVDLLFWNVFASFDSDRDRPFLAGQLQVLGSDTLRSPLGLSLWTGVHREPLLRPSGAYRAHLRRSSELDDDQLGVFTAPLEVPVRIEAPDVLVLVDGFLDAVPSGAGGRDRILELIDAGGEHARALGKQLVVAVLYRSGSPGARELSARLQRLREPLALGAAMPWLDRAPPVQLRELPWQRLLRVWEHSLDGLKLSRQPVKAFLDYAASLGLR